MWGQICLFFEFMRIENEALQTMGNILLESDRGKGENQKRGCLGGETRIGRHRNALYQRQICWFRGGQADRVRSFLS